MFHLLSAPVGSATVTIFTVGMFEQFDVVDPNKVSLRRNVDLTDLSSA